MYLLDINHCSRLLAGDEHITRHLAALGDVFVATSVIVDGELPSSCSVSWRTTCASSQPRNNTDHKVHRKIRSGTPAIPWMISSTVRVLGAMSGRPSGAVAGNVSVPVRW
jgi:hypothetical protein